MIDAGLNRKDDALREGRRASELMPPSKDSINGAHIMHLLAVIYAWVGEKDLAIDQLKRATEAPGRLSYGHLRLWFQWDSLRGDPRFEKIVASLAPKNWRGRVLDALCAPVDAASLRDVRLRPSYGASR